MVIHMRYTGLYVVTMGTENEPNSTIEMSMFFNKMDESLGYYFSVLFLRALYAY